MSTRSGQGSSTEERAVSRHTVILSPLQHVAGMTVYGMWSLLQTKGSVGHASARSLITCARRFDELMLQLQLDACTLLHNYLEEYDPNYLIPLPPI